MRRSPLLRIALLSLAVLWAHTTRAANVERIVPAGPPCAAKVAAAQPDPEKKLSPAGKGIAGPGHPVDSHNLSGGWFGFTTARAASLLPAHCAGAFALTRRTVYVALQRSPFVLRI